MALVTIPDLPWLLSEDAVTTPDLEICPIFPLNPASSLSFNLELILKLPVYLSIPDVRIIPSRS